MKDIIGAIVLYVVCMLVFMGLIGFAVIHFGPILWEGVLQGTTEITKAITAGQLAR